MRKGLVLLSLIALFVACGKKEETSKTEVVVPVVVEQVVEEKKVEEVAIPVIVEETITEEVDITENKMSEVIENIEESVVVDVAEATGGDGVVEMPAKEEVVVVREVPVEEVSTVATEEKIEQ